VPLVLQTLEHGVIEQQAAGARGAFGTGQAYH
jgi:hypothetical protein